MGHPLHKKGCFSKIYSVACPDCKGAAYKYSCSCHSNVLLDENQPPWTPHDCGWSKQLATLKRHQQTKDSQIKLIKKSDFKKKQKAKKAKIGPGLSVQASREAAKKRQKERVRKIRSILDI
jgi:hypothetical protein